MQYNMKIGKKLTIFIVLLLCFATLLCGCGEKGGEDSGEIKEEDIKDIFIRIGSLKSEYKIDEQLDYSILYIIVTSKTSTRQQVVPITEKMMSGFDTTTSGKKTLTVTYKGKKATWIYNVVAENKKISTSARMGVAKVISGNFATITVELKVGDLDMDIKAVEFEFHFDTSKYTFSKDTGTMNAAKNGWFVEKSFMSNTGYEFNAVVYAGVSGEAITQNADVLVVDMGYQNAGEGIISLKNITVSDGEKEIILPDCVG